MTRGPDRGGLYEGQALHALLLAGLLAVTFACARAMDLEAGVGWLVAGIAVAVGHQVWVWLWWRLEYHHGAATRRLGAAAFRIYSAGFALFVPAGALSASLGYLISPSDSATVAKSNFGEAWDVFVQEPYDRAIVRPIGAW